MRIPFQLSILASAVVLAGCGGGGGGPGGSVNTGTGYVRSSVSYATPSQINAYAPLEGTGVNAVVSDVFVKDLNNDSVDEVVVGGRMSQPATAATWRNTNLQLYGWNTGSFTNETSSWFSGSDNVIVGSEPSIKFGDFDGDGNIDMFSAPSTDMSAKYGNAVVFRNSGSDTFTRSTIATAAGDSWTHDSWVGDLNGDGRDDIVMSNIGGDRNLVVNYGNADGTFSTYYGTTPGGSGISIADYMGNGTKTIILTDTATSVQSDTKLFSFTTSGADTLALTEIATLPTSYFYNGNFTAELATAGNAPHEIRNFSMDFNNDGVMDVVVVSNLSGNDINMSAMQFLRNDGGGSFTDVTDSVLVNYDHDIQASYQPVIVDINNDGLDDILLSTSDDMATGYHDATRVLVQTSDGKFVQKYDDVFKDFYNQVYNSTSNALNWAQPINIVVGPGGEKYLFTTVMYNDSGNVKAHTYLAKIGTTGTISAQSAADVIAANWPYLSAPEVNDVLARTSPLSFNGTPVVDLASALQPVGDLTINSVRLGGSISAPGLNTDMFNGIQSLDALGRNYTVDLGVLAHNGMNAPTTVNNYVEAQSWSSNFITNEVNDGIQAYGNNNQYTTGYSSGDDLRWGFSHTRIDGYSPWLSMSGVFGEVKSSDITEFTLYKKHDNSWAQLGINRTQTDITPGIITDVKPIDAIYMVAGHKFDGWLKGFEVMTGIEPKIIAGSLGVKLPKSVDNSGNVMYSYDNVNLKNTIRRFTKVNYTYNFPYDGKIKIGGSLGDTGISNTVMTIEMPL